MLPQCLIQIPALMSVWYYLDHPHEKAGTGALIVSTWPSQRAALANLYVILYTHLWELFFPFFLRHNVWLF